MIQYLIVLLDEHATSFCHYENPAYYRHGEELMPIKELKSVIDYAARNKISVNFIYGNNEPPPRYAELIKGVAHVKIKPLKLLKEIQEGIFVINEDDRNRIKEIEKNSHINLILRLEKRHLGELAEIFWSLLGRFRRLNLCLLNTEAYHEEDLREYDTQLRKIEKYAAEAYKAGKGVETNFISDRLSLQNMKNCDAGITHLTVGVNGKAYLCPGFYYGDRTDSIGVLTQEVGIDNDQLLRLDHSPICRSCDAYHCKRCVYLNKMTTLEINTPSHQQCVISHQERNASMRILNTLKRSVKLSQDFVPIPKIPYIDPFEILNNRLNHKTDHQNREGFIADLLSKPLEKIDVRELLRQVYQLDRNLLVQLKKMNLDE